MQRKRRRAQIHLVRNRNYLLSPVKSIIVPQTNALKRPDVMAVLITCPPFHVYLVELLLNYWQVDLG